MNMYGERIENRKGALVPHPFLLAFKSKVQMK